jgi:hypothetical protein
MTGGAEVHAQRSLLSGRIDPRTVALDDIVVVELEVMASRVRIRLPELPDFEVRDATPFMNRHMFCMNDGLRVMSGPCELILHLYPRKEGHFTIPSFELVPLHGGERVLARTEAVEVTVTAAAGQGGRSATRPGQAQRRSPQIRQPMGSAGGSKEPVILGNGATKEKLRPLEELTSLQEQDVFLFPRLNVTDLYLNQPALLEVFLLVSTDASFAGQAGLQDTNLRGFRSQKLDAQMRRFQDVRIGSRLFQVYRLASFSVVPLESGVLTLEALRGQVMLNSSSFQQFPGGMGFTIQFNSGGELKDVYGPPVELTVQTPPPPVPKGFVATNVGAFRLSGLVVPDQAPANTWFPVRFEVEGEGNLYLVTPPALTETGALSVRKPYLDTSGIVADERGVRGKVTVHLEVKARNPGPLTIELPEFVYFQPETRTYERAVLPPVQVTVVDAGRNDAETQIRGSAQVDLLSIQDWSVVEGSTPGFLPHPMVPFVLGVAASVLVLALLLRWLVRALQGDPRRQRRRRALQESLMLLSSGRRLAGAGDAAGAYAFISRGLTTFLDARFGVSFGSVTLEVLTQRLRDVGVPEDLAVAVRQELESAEFGRFAPSQRQQGDLEATFGRVSTLLKQMGRLKADNGKGRRAGKGLTAMLVFVVVAGGVSRVGHGTETDPRQVKMEEARSRFEAGAFAEAGAIYSALLAEQSVEHPALLYNLGQVSLAVGHLGKARYFFEKVSRMDALDIQERAEAALAVVLSVLQERYRHAVEKGRLQFDESHGAAYAVFTWIPLKWISLLWLATGLLWLAGLAGWLLLYRGTLRALARVMGISLLFPVLLAGAFYWGRVLVDRQYQLGIVVSPAATMLEAPSDSAPGEELAEALRIRVKHHNQAGYYLVERSDGKTGYVRDDRLWLFDQRKGL